MKACVHMWCLEEAPRFGAQNPPWPGVPSPHWILHICSSGPPQNRQEAHLHHISPDLLCDTGQVSNQLWVPAFQSV